MEKFRPCDREQTDLRARPGGGPGAFRDGRCGVGRSVPVARQPTRNRVPPVRPRRILSLLIGRHALGIGSSCRIEQSTWRELGVRYVAANQHPDHATIAKFRREQLAAIDECFRQVLELETVSVDWTKINASASK